MNRLQNIWSQINYDYKATYIEKILDTLCIILRSLKKSPLPFLMGVVSCTAVVTVSCFVLGGIDLLTRSVSNAKNTVQLGVYLKDEIKEDQLSAIQNEINKSGKISSLNFISKEDALKSFKSSIENNASSSSSFLNQALKENPLPASYEITFKDQETSNNFVNNHLENLKKLEGVDSIEFDEGALALINRGVKSLKIFVILASFILVLIAGSIISSSITLILHSHKREIEVLSLVGAKPNYIFVPYLVEGVTQGLLGGFLGIIISSILWNSLINTFSSYGLISSSDFQVGSLVINNYVLALSIIISFLASFVSIRRNASA